MIMPVLHMQEIICYIVQITASPTRRSTPNSTALLAIIIHNITFAIQFHEVNTIKLW